MATMEEIRFGGETHEFFSLVPLRRTHPARDDFWDGNWLRCRAEVQAGGFRATVKNDLRAEELLKFYNQLQALYKTLTGAAVLTTLEDWVQLEVTGDGQEHVLVTGILGDALLQSNVLRFQIELDQTFLPGPLRQLEAALQGFPIRGSREDVAPECAVPISLRWSDWVRSWRRRV